MTPKPRAPRRRGLAWVALGHGVHRPADVADDQVFAAELRAWQEKLPASGMFTHLTAARAHGLWLPPLPGDLPVFLAIPKSTARPRRREVRVTRHCSLPPSTTVGAIRLAAVAHTLLACAADLQLLDLVVLIDSALHLRRVTLDELAAAAQGRRIGAGALRAALRFVDGRSESPWESVLRMFHVAVEAPVVPQVNISDAAGRFIGRADLVVSGTRWVHEYDGAGHRDSRQHRADLRRERALLAAGHPRRGYTSDDIAWSPFDILRDIDAALGRPHEPARLAVWESWWGASLFSRAGTFALRARWGLEEREREQNPFDPVPPDNGTIVLW